MAGGTGKPAGRLSDNRYIAAITGRCLRKGRPGAFDFKLRPPAGSGPQRDPVSEMTMAGGKACGDSGFLPSHAVHDRCVGAEQLASWQASATSDGNGQERYPPGRTRRRQYRDLGTTARSGTSSRRAVPSSMHVVGTGDLQRQTAKEPTILWQDSVSGCGHHLERWTFLESVHYCQAQCQAVGMSPAVGDFSTATAKKRYSLAGTITGAGRESGITA